MIESLKTDLKAQSATLLKTNEELQTALFKIEMLEKKCIDLKDATAPNVLMNKLKQQERIIANLEKDLVAAKRKRACPADTPVSSRCADDSLGKRYLDVAVAHNYSTNMTPTMVMDALYRRKFMTQNTKFVPPSFIGVFTLCLHKLRTENKEWYDRYYPDYEDTEAVCWKMFELNTHTLMLSYMYYHTIRDTMMSKSNVTTAQMDLVKYSLQTDAKGFVTATETAYPQWAQCRQQALDTYKTTKRKQLWQPSPNTQTPTAPVDAGMKYMAHQISELMPEFAKAQNSKDKQLDSTSTNPLNKIDPLVSGLLSRMT